MVPRTKIINSGCHQSVGSRSAQALERSASSSSGMKVFTILPTTNTQSPKTHGFSSVCVPITNHPVPDNWHNDVHKLKLIHNVMQNGSDFRSSDVSLKGKLLFDEGKLTGPVTHLSLAARSRACIKTCSAVASVALPNSRAHARTQDKYKHTHNRASNQVSIVHRGLCRPACRPIDDSNLGLSSSSNKHPLRTRTGDWSKPRRR